MAKIMKGCALTAAVLTAIFTALCPIFDFCLSLAITCGTTAYHLCMRLLVGEALDRILQNRVNYRRMWFQVHSVERKLYEKLRVKKWKARMPTYDKTAFDPKQHSWDEIAQAMCQSELVHEIIFVLSFLPVLATVWFGELPVFLITSCLAACFDLLFVMIQRYNRPRIIKFAERHGGNGNG